MDPVPEYSLFLGRILDELGSQSRTQQDLCGSLCARFDLVHLAKLRSLLFSMACLEPSFPAAQFQDRMRRSPPEPQARKLAVAADIVRIFNLIQMDRDAKDTPPATIQDPQSQELLRAGEAFRYQDNQRRTGFLHHLDRPHHKLQQHLEVQGSCAALEPSEPNSCQYLQSSDPNFLLRPGVKSGAQDKALPPSGPHSPLAGPHSSYFSMDTDSESTSKPESLQAPDAFSHSCSQRRSIHNLLTFSPQVRDVRQLQEGLKDLETSLKMQSSRLHQVFGD